MSLIIVIITPLCYHLPLFSVLGKLLAGYRQPWSADFRVSIFRILGFVVENVPLLVIRPWNWNRFLMLPGWDRGSDRGGG